VTPTQTTLVPMERTGVKPSDIAYTPGWVVARMLDDDAAPDHRWTVLDPCAGDGAIVRVLLQRGYQAHAVEIREECLADLERLCPTAIGDWLALAHLTQPEAIVTNPPFSLGPQFARESRLRWCTACQGKRLGSSCAVKSGST